MNVGQSLTTTNGQWSGGPSSYTYRWLRCDAAGANPAAIGGATGGSYRLVSADAGSTIRSEVTAHYSGGQTAVVNSQQTAVIVAGGGSGIIAVSANGRYLVDATGNPIPMIADSSQALIYQLAPTDVNNGSTHDMGWFMRTRVAQGFNALWMIATGTAYVGGRADWSTYDGITPFTGNLPAPNGALYSFQARRTTYFDRVKYAVDLATSFGFAVILLPVQTGQSGSGDGRALDTIIANAGEIDGGTGKSYAYLYGQWIAQQYDSYSNVMWLHGNDYNDWPTDDTYLNEVVQGIRDTSAPMLQGIEISSATTFNDTYWTAGRVDYDGIYRSGGDIPSIIYTDYNRNALPVVFLEGDYEREDNNFPDAWNGGTPQQIRAQMYWTFLAGGCSHFWGNGYAWKFMTGFWDTTDGILSAPSYQVAHFSSLFASINWWDLKPDGNAGGLITSGLGSWGTQASMNSVAGAYTADGTLAIVYVPPSSLGSTASRNVTISLGANSPFPGFAGPVTAKWYDPTNGSLGSAISGSPFTASGTHVFATPGANNAGQGDWILKLEA